MGRSSYVKQLDKAREKASHIEAPITIEERAKEFCQGAFGPFGVDIEPYAKIVAELLRGAVDQERTRCINIANAVDSKRGNEAMIADAIRAGVSQRS